MDETQKWFMLSKQTSGIDESTLTEKEKKLLEMGKKYLLACGDQIFPKLDEDPPKNKTSNI